MANNTFRIKGDMHDFVMVAESLADVVVALDDAAKAAGYRLGKAPSDSEYDYGFFRRDIVVETFDIRQVMTSCADTVVAQITAYDALLQGRR